MAEFAVTVIGAGSALPMHGRHPSSQVIQYDDQYFMIDCGESTQMRLRDAGIKLFRINMIMISHLHGDHVFGLPGLLSTFSHLQRREPLVIHGPIGIRGLIEEIIHYTEMKIPYRLDFNEHTPQGLHRIYEAKNFEILTFPLYHRIPCNGYLFREKNSPVKLKKELIASQQLSIDQIHDIQRGLDITIGGRVFSNSDLTYPREDPLSYAYCSDTRFDVRVASFVRNVSVLYHETTFRNELIRMAEQTGHTTAGEAGRIAEAAKAKCLITGHYSSRYKGVQELLDEAGEHFGNVLEAVEGKRYNIRALGLGSKGAPDFQVPGS